MPLQLVIASDIKGVTPALREFASGFKQTTYLLDPYNGENQSLEDEKQAYTEFQNRCGLTAYADKALSLINSLSGKVIYIGFSVGASAGWLINHHGAPLHRSFLFYGNQIRHFTEKAPMSPIECIVPAKEDHFDLDALISDLSGSPLVSLHKSTALHGFMDKSSPNYQYKEFERFKQMIEAQIS